MAFFKKQRLRYQEWLNSFVVRHHDKWYMPFITFGIGLAYIIGFVVAMCVLATLIGIMVHYGTLWLLTVILGVWAVYGVGMIIRVPGDSEYDRQKNPLY